MNTTLTILGMAVITFLIRYIPYARAGKLKFPQFLETALRFTPVAVLTAIVVPGVLIGASDGFDFSLQNPYLLSAILGLVIALWSKNLFLTICLGMVIFLGLSNWL